MSITFYNNNAESFFNDTVAVNLMPLYLEFLPLLTKQAHILDAGYGSGRDTKYFIEQGFNVSAFDASCELAQKASDYTGITVEVNTFKQYQSTQAIDAIWACASLLHVPSNQLKQVFSHLAKQLTPQGVFYCSFKYGDDDVMHGDRFFTNSNESRLAQFIDGSSLTINKTWLTPDARPDRQDEKWLNALLVKA